VQAEARSKGYWPFRVCFEAGQRTKPGPGGETKVAFSIGTHGKVRAARLLNSELGNPTSAACLVSELKKLEFTPRPAAVMAMVALIRVYPGDAALPDPPGSDAPATTATTATVATIPSAFDAEAMRARVSERQAELNTCFDEARRADPALWGRLALTVILEMDGSVHRVSEIESHFPNASATRCTQVLLSKIVFPTVNGKPYSFVVPIRLSPTGLLGARERTGSDVVPSPLEAAEAGVPGD
jgi:hypothetical protein